MKNSSRVLALFMALLMIASLLSGAALASEEPVAEPVEEPIEETLQEPEEEPEAEPAEEPIEEPVEMAPVPLEEATEAELPAVDGGTVTVSSEFVETGVTQAKVRVKVSSPASGAIDTYYVLLYREKGQKGWDCVYMGFGEVTETSAVIALSGLKENTTYEYRGVYEVFKMTGDNYEVYYTREKTVHELTTGKTASMKTLKLNSTVSIPGTTKAEYAFTAPSDGYYLFTASDGLEMSFRSGNRESLLQCFEMKKNDVVMVFVTNYGEESGSLKVTSHTPLGVKDYKLSVGTPKSDGTTVSVDATYSVPLGKMVYLYTSSSANAFLDCWAMCFREVKDGKETIQFENLIPGFTYSFTIMLQEMKYDDTEGFWSETENCIVKTFEYTVPSTASAKTIKLGDKATEYAVYCFTAPKDGTYAVDTVDGYATVGINGEFPEGDSFSLKKNDKMYIIFNPWEDGAYLTVTEAAEPGTQPAETKITSLTVKNNIVTMDYEISAGTECDTEIILKTEDGEEICSYGEWDSKRTSGRMTTSLKGEVLAGVKYKIVGKLKDSEQWDEVLAQKEISYTAPSAEVVTVRLGETVEPESNTCVYAFTPTETGWYSFGLSRMAASLFAQDGERLKSYYWNSEDEKEQVKLTAGKAYYLILNSISASSEFVVERFVPTVTKDRITAVTAKKIGDCLRVSVTYDAMISDYEYEIGVKILDAENKQITKCSSNDASEAKGETFEFDLELGRYVPGGVYSLEAYILRDGEKTAQMSASELTWPTFETETLTLNVPTAPYTGRWSETKMYSFTAPAEGYYDFTVENAYNVRFYSPEGKEFEHEFNFDSVKPAYTVYLKQGERCCVTVWFETDGTLTVVQGDKPQLYVTVSDAVVHPGDTVTVTVKTWANPGVTDMTFSVGVRHNGTSDNTWVKESTYTSAQPTTSELSWSYEYTVPETAKNGDEIGFFIAVPEEYAKNGSTPVEFERSGAELTVDAHTPGDLTGDGKSDLLDLVRLMKHLANDMPCEAFAADADGNGRINALDLVLLAKYLSGEKKVIN